VVPTPASAIISSTSLVTWVVRYIVTPIQLHVACDGTSTVSRRVEVRSIVTNRTLLGSLSPAFANARRFHAWVPARSYSHTVSRHASQCRHANVSAPAPKIAHRPRCSLS
jgi:hypothetical protein